MSFKKRFSKFVAIFLALLLMLEFIPVSAFALQDEFHYVAIGDSTSNGFGFEDYYLEDGTDVRGFDQVVPEAYPALIAEMLEKEGKDVVLHQFAGSALRPDDLDAILDPNHIDDDYTSRVFTGHNRGRNTDGEEWFETWGHLLDNSVSNCAEGEEVLRAEFYSVIPKADLITYYLGSNNFGTFITGAIIDNRYGDTDTLQDLLSALGIPKEAVNVAEIRAKLMGMLVQQFGGQLDIAGLDAQFGNLIDLFVHGYVGAVVYFTKNIEAIRMLNPDCDLVVVGLHNYVDFIKADYNGQQINVGEFYGMLLEMLNVYMASLCSRSDDYYYADLAEAKFPVFVQELIDKNPSATMQGYLDEMVGGMAKGIAPVLSSYPDKAVGAMLRGWYEDGFSDSDYMLLAQLAAAMGLIDQETAGTLQGLGLDVPSALKLADLYHSENDAFVPAFYDLIPVIADPSLAPTIQMFLKPDGEYISFRTLENLLNLVEFIDYGQSFTGYLTLLDGVGEQLDTFKNYGRVQEILIDCVSFEPFDLSGVLGAFSQGINMDSIGTEVAAVITGQQKELTDSTKTLINLYFMFMFPNGMGIGAHPNEEGHKVMADVIYNAYKNRIIAKDYMSVKILAVAENLIDDFIASQGDMTVKSYSEINLKNSGITAYTSLGDSTVFGFGLEDFEVGSKIFDDTYGYGAYSEYSYPALLANALGISSENFYQLSMGSLRAEDILSVLKGDTTGDEYYVNTILPLLNKHAGGIEKAHADYVEAITNSGLVTIAMGGNNFGTFIESQVGRVMEGKAPMALDWSKYSTNKLTAVNAAIGEVFDMLLSFNPNSQTALLKVLAETFIYEYVTVLENYAPILDEIHSLNPDAKIIFIGLFNPADDVYYQKDGTESKLKLGKILDIFMSNLNKAFRSYAELHNDYCGFVNVEDARMFIDTDENIKQDLAGDEYLPYVTANHGVANHPDAVGHAYMFDQILKATGLKYPDCIVKKTITLSDSGTYELALNGEELGEYEFTKSGNSYLISKDGMYLTFENGTVGTDANADKAYKWKYSGSRFSATVTTTQRSSLFMWWFMPSTQSRTETFYLTANEGALAVTSVSGNANAVITKVIINEEHSFLDWTPAEEGQHSRICSACGYEDCEECEYGDDHKCTFCGADDPSFTPKCVAKKNASLSEGKLVLTLGGKEAGEYTFAKSGNGWTIKNADGKYLGFANRAFAYSDSQFVWTYSNNRFATSVASTSGSSFGFGMSRNTTYYLAYNGNVFSASTSTSGSNAAFAIHIESDEHTGKWIPSGNVHTRVCDICKTEETEPCVYGNDHKCIVCGGYDPAFSKVEVSVATSTRSGSSGFGFFGWGWGGTTTYSATITTKATGAKVSKVEYSVNNGANWATASSFTSNTAITEFLIRVTGDNGAVYKFKYKNGTVSKYDDDQ